MSKLIGKEIRVRAGEPIKVEVPVTGSPAPVITWNKDDKNLSPSDRVHAVLFAAVLIVIDAIINMYFK